MCDVKKENISYLSVGVTPWIYKWLQNKNIVILI